MRRGFAHLLIAIGAAIFSGAICQARVKARDFFPSGTPLALAEAAADGRVEKIAQLVKAGADINAQGNEGMTALIWAFMHESKKGYQYLLEHGANPNLQVGSSELTSDGLIDGNSAVSLAAMHEDPWYLELTLKHGGNPNIWNPVKGVTPIFQCIMLLDRRRPRPRLEQLKMLIAAGADLNARNRDGYTPMIQATWASRFDMVYLMLQAGADPKIKLKSGGTIVYDIRKSHTDPKSDLYRWRAKVIELLRGQGIDMDVKTGPAGVWRWPGLGKGLKPIEYVLTVSVSKDGMIAGSLSNGTDTNPILNPAANDDALNFTAICDRPGIGRVPVAHSLCLHRIEPIVTIEWYDVTFDGKPSGSRNHAQSHATHELEK